MDAVPITLAGTPDRIRALRQQLEREGLVVDQVSDTQLLVYVSPMSRDEAVTFLVNNR